MQILDKRERDMTADEKLALEVMRTFAAAKMAKMGISLRHPGVDLDFRVTSNFSAFAHALLKRFNVTYKKPDEAKVWWPESDLRWKGKTVQHNSPPDPVRATISDPSESPAAERSNEDEIDERTAEKETPGDVENAPTKEEPGSQAPKAETRRVSAVRQKNLQG
jgi:hypothetical protein